MPRPRIPGRPDQLEPAGAISGGGVLAAGDLAEERPAARRGERLLVGRSGAVHRRDKSLAAGARFEASRGHAGILPLRATPRAREPRAGRAIP